MLNTTTLKNALFYSMRADSNVLHSYCSSTTKKLHVLHFLISDQYHSTHIDIGYNEFIFLFHYASFHCGV